MKPQRLPEMTRVPEVREFILALFNPGVESVGCAL